MICDCCKREVDYVRGSLWHGSSRICRGCFGQWYDPDNDEVDPTQPESIGNYVRKKHGLEPLIEVKAKEQATFIAELAAGLREARAFVAWAPQPLNGHETVLSHIDALLAEAEGAARFSASMRRETIEECERVALLEIEEAQTEGELWVVRRIIKGIAALKDAGSEL